ncbi:hypothetical protein M1446_04155 [Candidatus Dependentiae bacterium]|nr:hypothetical protein [Candidatus Dependentiae bacterium]
MKKVFKIILLLSTIQGLIFAQERRIPGLGQNQGDVVLYPTDRPRESVVENIKKQYAETEKKYYQLKNELKNLNMDERKKRQQEFNDLLEKYLNLKKYLEQEDIFGFVV